MKNIKIIIYAICISFVLGLFVDHNSTPLGITKEYHVDTFNFDFVETTNYNFWIIYVQCRKIDSHKHTTFNLPLNITIE